MIDSLIKVLKPAARIAAPVIVASCLLGAPLHAQGGAPAPSPAQSAGPTPSPALLVTGGGGLNIVDPKTLQIVATIPSAGAREIAITPDSKLAMVSNWMGNTLALIDLKEQKELDHYKFPFPAGPNSLAYA